MTTCYSCKYSYLEAYGSMEAGYESYLACRAPSGDKVAEKVCDEYYPDDDDVPERDEVAE